MGQMFFRILVQRFSDLAHARQLQHSIEVVSQPGTPASIHSIISLPEPVRALPEKGIPPELQQLLDLLSISTFYDFGLVREHAIRAIEANGGLDPIDKICYANQCDIPEWLFGAYRQLSQRSAPLEVSEAERIGLTTAILVAKAREKIIRNQASGYAWNPHGTDPLDEIINSVFFNEKN